VNQAAQPTLAIGIVPRERFSVAAKCLRSIFENTRLDFELIIVDNCTPPRYWAEIEKILAGHENVQVIRTDRQLHPGPCKELIASASKQELTCLLENDVIVLDDWLPPLIAALEERSASVVTPLVLEDSPTKVHADMNFGNFDFRETKDGVELEIIPVAETAKELAGMKGLSEVDVAETHCLLFRTEILHRLRPFEEPLNTREFIDTSLTLHKAGFPIVFQPASRVVFKTPPPVELEERPFFLEKWNYTQAQWSHQRVREKWDLARIPESLPFLSERMNRITRWGWFWYTLTTRVPRRATRVLRETLARIRR
jgi:GT2 family glycosyltransferase